MTATPATLLTTLASRSGASPTSQAIRLASVLFITVLTAAAAQVSAPLPFTPVPFTFQPMVVLLGGLVLGARLGAASQLLYLAAGVAGLPVFAGSIALPPGALRLLGPTGGYLLAYPLAAFVTGYLAQRGFDRRYVTSFVAMLAGLVVVYAGGAAWLGLFARAATGPVAIGVQPALLAGVVPFVIPDLIKLAVAAGIVPGLWRLTGRA
jgi:biotin transport system substrate-specific component